MPVISEEEIREQLNAVMADYAKANESELTAEELVRYLDSLLETKRKAFLDKRFSFMSEGKLEAVRKVAVGAKEAPSKPSGKRGQSN